MTKLTRDEFNLLSKEEIMKAVSIVQFIIDDETNMSDYYLNGDKDTLNMATENVATRHLYDLSKINKSDVYNKHSEEVDKEFDRLVLQGVVDKKYYNRLTKHLGSIYLYFRRKQ
jgi:hypothetical protein